MNPESDEPIGYEAAAVEYWSEASRTPEPKAIDWQGVILWAAVVICVATLIALSFIH